MSNSFHKLNIYFTAEKTVVFGEEPSFWLTSENSEKIEESCRNGKVNKA
jgi:hypothetical protein